MTRSLLPTLFDNDKNHFSSFRSLQDEVDRVFEEFRKPKGLFKREDKGVTNGWLMPKIDVSETEKAIEVVAEIPGVKESDIDITVTNNTLLIKGEKCEEREEKEKDYHLVERSQGSYMRSIPIGFSAEPDDVKATFDAGVLKVSIKKPKEIQAQTKKIAITKAT